MTARFADYRRGEQEVKPEPPPGLKLADPRLLEARDEMVGAVVAARIRTGEVRRFSDFDSLVQDEVEGNGGALFCWVAPMVCDTMSLEVALIECVRIEQKLLHAAFNGLSTPTEVESLLAAARRAIGGFELAMRAAEAELAAKGVGKAPVVGKEGGSADSATVQAAAPTPIVQNAEARQNLGQNGAKYPDPRLTEGFKAMSELMVRVLQDSGKYVRPDDECLPAISEMCLYAQVAADALKAQGRDTAYLQVALDDCQKAEDVMLNALFSCETDPVLIEGILAAAREAITEFGVLLAAESRSTATTATATAN